MATNTTGDERIGDYKYIRTIYPGSTSIVMEVVQEAQQRGSRSSNCSPRGG